MGTAAFGHGRVRQVVRGKLSVGVEDVTQQVLLWSSCDSGEVGADVVSEAPDGMTGNAVLLEERCALFRIARACEGAPIVSDDLAAVLIHRGLQDGLETLSQGPGCPLLEPLLELPR